MTQTVLKERVGRVIKSVKGANGQDATIIRSMLLKEVFPDDRPGLEVIFDFFNDEQGQLAVHVQRKTSAKVRQKCHWTLSAIENRDATGLEGFREFADSLGLKGFQLANIICGLKPR